MELQTCLLFTTLVVCGADIRPAGWLDKVVAHWKKSFIDDFEQLGPFNLDASIVPAPPGYQDSPEWDFDSVSRMLALLSVSETGQPALNSLRRMIAPTRRMMMDVPGLAVNYIPQSLYNNQRGKHRSGKNNRRGVRNNRKRKGNNNRMGTNNRMGMADNRKGMANNRMRMADNRKGMANNRMRMADNRKGMANNRMRMADNRKGMANYRMGMANNRMGMANNRKGMAYDRMGMQSKTGNGVVSRKQNILEKRFKEKVLSDFQMSFRLFPSIKERIPNNIYYDEELYDYEDESPEYEFVDPNRPDRPEDAIVLLKNPVEARLPSSRISVKLLKEILEARAEAARVMPPKKTTQFSWKPMDMTTPLNNETSGDNSTATDGTAATGGTDDGAVTGGASGAETTPGGGGEATTAAAAGDAPAEEAKPDDPPPEGRKMAAKTSEVADKPLREKA